MLSMPSHAVIKYGCSDFNTWTLVLVTKLHVHLLARAGSSPELGLSCHRPPPSPGSSSTRLRTLPPVLVLPPLAVDGAGRRLAVPHLLGLPETPLASSRLLLQNLPPPLLPPSSTGRGTFSPGGEPGPETVHRSWTREPLYS